MAFERKQKPEKTPEKPQAPAIAWGGSLSEFLGSVGIPFAPIEGHAQVYSKVDFHGTCDRLIASGMRQIYGDFCSCHYEGGGRIIKVRWEKALTKFGNDFKYIERVTIG